MSKQSSGYPVIGINGFGRIGRLVLRYAFEQNALLNKPQIGVGAINDPALSVAEMAYLLKHDSVHGEWKNFNITFDDVTNVISINGNLIAVYNINDISLIPWSNHCVSYVCESSGVFTTTEKAIGHTLNSAIKVIISAPAKDEITPTLVYGINHEIYKSDMKVISNASCTTNCLVPLAYVVDNKFGIIEGLMTTVHAVTATQSTVDGSNKKDWRAGRCSSLNIIPASTGAAKAVGKVIPSLKGKLTGMAFRVPVPDVSVVDLTVRLAKPVQSISEISQAIQEERAKCKVLGSIIDVTTDAVVSSDFRLVMK